jgi:hypothetical protein
MAINEIAENNKAIRKDIWINITMLIIMKLIAVNTRAYLINA